MPGINPTRQITESESPEQRHHRRMIAELVDAGYVIGVSCRSCGATLTDSRSVATHLGPVCRGRREADQ